MDILETLYKSEKENTLASDSQYFKFIFKKSEKIVSAVFYITRSQTLIPVKDSIIDGVEGCANRLLETVFASLRVPKSRGESVLLGVRFTLLELESRLRLLEPIGILEPGLLTIFSQEIEVVQRTLFHYLEPKGRSAPAHPILPQQRETSTQTVAGPTSQKDMEGETGSSLSQRQNQILNIIKDKGQVTIKDISERITEYSEKTIQRELNALLRDRIIVREGERRWSRYRIA